MSFESEFKGLVAAVKEAHSKVSECDSIVDNAKHDRENAMNALEIANGKLSAFVKEATGGVISALWF